MTTLGRRRKPIRSRKILDAALGQYCTVFSPFCIDDLDSSVMAHSNYGEDGKGARQKADDIYVVIACRPCHDWLDGRIGLKSVDDEKAMKREYFHLALKRTWRVLFDMGILGVK